ncbi:hypothetical protein [Streptomyces sp. NPDC059788]|uniref:hypothetical protein n=1 Tax=Streptomyces sp. NPDC059788 TaxID=3346948 RepID=UPI00365D1B4C
MGHLISSAGRAPAGRRRRPRYVIRPAEHADHQVVRERLPGLSHFIQGDPVSVGFADCPLMSVLGHVARGHPLTWLLLDDSQIRGCALLVKRRASDERWRPQPGMALWIDDLYTDPDGPDPETYGPLLTGWFADYAARYEEVGWLAAWIADAAMADVLADRHGMEALRSTPTSATLLRRRPKLLPHLNRHIQAQLPPCGPRRRTLRTDELPRAD